MKGLFYDQNKMKPFSDKKKSLIINPLGDNGFHFAFNFENPTGVKLLTNSAAQRLISIINDEKPIDLNNSIDFSLNKSGLITEAILNTKSSDKKLSVWLHAVDACNLSCFYCYIPKLKKAVAIESNTLNKFSMNSQDAIVIADNLIAYCKNNEIENLHVKFAGGEPALNINLIDYFCAHIKKQSDIFVSFGMLTNGVFDSSQVIPVLQRHKISLSISLDGYELSHDEIRFEIVGKRKHGTWAKIFENIQSALSVDIHPYFLYTITPSNNSDLFKFSDFIHELGLGYRLSLIRSKESYPSEIQYEIIGNLSKLYRNLGENLDVNLPIARYAKFSEWNIKKKKDIVCTSSRKYVAIDQNGNISSCQMNMNNKFGNLLKNELELSLGRMKTDSHLLKIASPNLRDGICNSCEYFYVCSGGCPEHTIKSFGTIDVPSPWCKVFGSLVPIYIESIARQMLKNVRNKI
ncbi:MAG: radical SAM protein [Methylococcaceae bacterium]|nr:MAG: radical SAM protein [Methylococcaceae bacterium]